MRPVISTFAVLVLPLISSAYGADCTDSQPSPRAQGESIGANMTVTSSKRWKTPVIEGVVTTVDGNPIENAVIDVYSVKKFGNDPASDAKDSRPIASYRADPNGRFCLKDLAEGKYVLRTGTTQFAFCHLYSWVEKRSRFRKRKIGISLEPGT